jgi:hypothetical protein
MYQEATFQRLAGLCIPLLLVLASSPSLAGSYEHAKADLLARYPKVRLFETPEIFVAPVISGIVSAPTAAKGREQVVLEFARRYGALLGFNPSTMSLQLARRTSLRAHELLVFEQRIADLPVYDSALVARFDAQGRLTQLSSALAKADDAAQEPSLSEARAVEIASSGYDPRAPYYAELGYLPVQGKPILVYMVIQERPGPHRYMSFVDAQGGAVLLRHDAIRRHQAWVYENNPVVDNETLTQVELLGIVQNGESSLHTYGEYARIASCGELTMSPFEVYCSGVTHWAVASPESGFLDVLPVLDADVFDDGFAEVMNYYVLDRINRWFRDTFGFQGQFFDAQSFRDTGKLTSADYLWAYPNAEYPNGFFAPGMDYPGYERPDMIVLGSIYGKDLAYDNDVMAHEFGHAVSSKAFLIGMGDLDSLGINLTSGAVEEGSADYFSSTFQGDPNVGEYVGVSRTLDNEFTCPKDLIGEGHHDGQIVAGAMWNIRTAIGAAKTDNLYYQALSSHQISTFNDWVKAIETEAYHLAKEGDATLRLTEEDTQVIYDEIAARHLKDCKRLVPLEEGMPPLLQYTALGISSEGTPSAVQYEVRTKEDTTALTLNISPMGDVDYDVLVRADDPVSFKWSTGGRHSYSWNATYDTSWKYNGDSPITSITLSSQNDFPLQGDTNYYFSIICRPNMYSANAAGCRNMLTVELSNEPPPDPDTDSRTEENEDTTDEDSTNTSNDTADDTDSDSSQSEEDPQSNSKDDGCGCRSVGVSTSNSLVRLLTILL